VLLFQHLMLDSFQAGLSWAIILRKRDNFRRAFDDFRPDRIAHYDSQRITSLLQDPGIVRNRLKVEATVNNARAFLRLRDELGSFSDFLWSFVDGETRQNHWQSITQVPARTAQSDAMSRALKARGFAFVGSTICYAFMQATGMINDHIVPCFRHAQLHVDG
jgi:DNA-3-methyladenine glycosylase I